MTHAMAGDLIRLMDAECDGDERAALETHLASCAACAVERKAMDDAAAQVRDALRLLDAAPVVARRSRRLPRLAVAIAAVTLIALAPPVRAWITTHVAALWTALTAGAAPATAPHAAQRAATPAAGVAFVPSGPAFQLEVSGRQAAGEVTLRFAAGDTAVAAVQGDTLGESLVVLPAALRVATTARSAATYHLVLPSRLSAVWIVVGNESPIRVPVTTPGAEWILSLGPAPRALVRMDAR